MPLDRRCQEDERSLDLSLDIVPERLACHQRKAPAGLNLQGPVVNVIGWVSGSGIATAAICRCVETVDVDVIPEDRIRGSAAGYAEADVELVLSLRIRIEIEPRVVVVVGRVVVGCSDVGI